MNCTGIPTRLLGAFALSAAAFLPTVLAAQSIMATDGTPGTRSSPVPSYHLVQLSVDSSDVAVSEFQTRTAAIRSCSDAANLAREIGADLKRNRFVRATDMPGQFRDLIKDLPAGKATPVFTGGGSDALRVFVMCNRD